jgi:hypothetical protein
MNQSKMNGKQVCAKELTLFSLGMVVATSGVSNSIPRREVLTALDRHHRGDCGTPGLSDSGGGLVYAAWAGARSASNWLGERYPRAW